MDSLHAVLIVVASYVGYLLAWRRVLVTRGRRSGPDPAELARYDHRELALELGPLLDEDDTTGRGVVVVPAPAGPLGALPDLWATAPWSHAEPGRLRAARDLLLAGRPEDAARSASGEEAPSASVRSLFTWAFLQSLFGGRLAQAAEIARHLEAIDLSAAPLRHRLGARLDAVRAELADGGQSIEAACASGMRHLRRAARSADERGPAEAGLAAHFEILRLSFWDLEFRELAARRHLRRALARHPQAAILHLIRAHLSAVLGDGAGATDHLARALYYARGDRFYAGPIAASAYVARVRPALAAEARGIVGAARQAGE